MMNQQQRNSKTQVFADFNGRQDFGCVEKESVRGSAGGAERMKWAGGGGGNADFSVGVGRRRRR